MPVAVAIAIRYIIMAATQLGIWSLLERFGLPLINNAIAGIMQFFGVSEEDAKDIMANKILIAFEEVGIFAVTLKTKLPIKVAERLGFTSKGYVIRKAKTVAVVKAETEVAKIAVAKTGGAVITTAEAVTAVETAKVAKLGFKPAYDIVLKLVGVTFLGFMVVGNWIDFGNWNNGAYQKSMQKFIAWITFGALVPDTDYRKSLTVSDEIFSKIFNTFKLGGAMGIQDPFKGVEVPFTRDNLLDLTDKVGSTLLLTDGSASAKKVLGAVLPMIIFNTNADVDSAITKEGGAIQTKSTQIATPQITKVYTGIVSQGVVSEGLSFTPRPDDMIDSIEELKQAASNNLAPYLQALLGKIVYEVKIVSSIISKDGFKQTGTTQRIQYGTYSNGTPKYKNVTNKFATLVLYALTDKGSRAKLSTIVLGPTNSAKLTVAQNDLQALQNELPSLVTTTDINEITNIKNTTDKYNITTGELNPDYIETTVQPVTVSTPSGIDMGTVKWFKGIAKEGSGFSSGSEFYTQINGQLIRKRDNAIIDWDTGMATIPASTPATSQSVTTTNSPANKAGSNASTLYDWYQAQGQTLPSVSARALIYAGFGLGQASYYTGTSEQNTKLLAALKTT